MAKLIITNDTPVILAAIPAGPIGAAQRTEKPTRTRVGTHLKSQQVDHRISSYRVARGSFTRLDDSE